MGSVDVPTQLGHFDVVVVGGGVCGVWLLHALREEGFNVCLLEAGTALGGVWHTNAYPGARVDTGVPTYQLTAPETYESFDWQETFPGRAELLRYFENLDKVWDLSKDVNYSSRLTEMTWDPADARWQCKINNTQAECTAWAVILSTGFASSKYIPPFKNLDAFRGEMYHTGAWPQAGVELKDRKVAVIGTGASGIQTIQEVSKIAAHLTVFQRTPNMALPMRNCPVDNTKLRAEFPDIAEKMGKTFAGLDFEFTKGDRPAPELPREERMQLYETLYRRGGLDLWLGMYIDNLFSEELNEEVYQFWRSKTVQRILNATNADILAPMQKVHPFGAKRISLERGFFEIFDQNNVELVDLRETPIKEFNPTGIRTADGTERSFDLIVLATGYDSYTGGITSIDIRGDEPQTKSLKEKWGSGVHTNFGMTTAGFPNCFFTYGPQAPTAFATGPSAAETQGQWIVRCLQDLRENGYKSTDATPEAEKEWRAHVNELCNASLMTKADSWYMAANIPGKPREALNYFGGWPEYRRRIWESASKGYAGFTLIR